MPEAKPPAHLSVTLDSAKHPCESDRGSVFLRDRIKLFAKIVFGICFGFYVLVNVLAALGPTHSWSCCVRLPANWFHLGVCVLPAGIWWYLSRACLCRGGLRRTDALGTIVLCSSYAGVFLAEGFFESNPYGLLLAVVYTLMTRAIIVPSSAWTTLWITTAAVLPGAFTGCYLLLERFEDGPAGTAATTPIFAFYVAWYVVAVVVATVASRVIYGLQREVQQARRLGQYTLEEKLGEGGMGEVYKASHVMLRRPTAVKLLLPDKAGERSLARFEREVQLTSSLTHPNTIAIYDYGRTPEGTFYYAMEYLDGLNLEQLVEKYGPQPVARTVHILKQVCASLAEAHGVGLIHRDIKPANVILCERGGYRDVAKVVDFGLVKDIEHKQDVSVSAPNTITGTPLYMSPEAISSPEKVGPRSDLYAVGCLGYYLLTGTHVFESKNVFEVASHQLHTKPEPPSVRLGQKVPEDLEGLVLMCLEKDAARRPKDARSLHDALGACKHAGAWTEEHAASWWQEHAEERGSAKKEQPATTPAQAARAVGPTASIAVASGGESPGGRTS